MPIKIDKFLGAVREKDAATLPEIDETPTENSENLITSGAVSAALDDIEAALDDIETELSGVQTTLGDIEAALDAIINGGA